MRTLSANRRRCCSPTSGNLFGPACAISFGAISKSGAWSGSSRSSTAKTSGFPSAPMGQAEADNPDLIRRPKRRDQPPRGDRQGTERPADARPGDSQGDRPPPPETLLRLPQRQNAAVRRQQPPSNLAATALPSTGDKPASGNIGSCGLAEIARIGFDNQILHEIRYLRHIGQPAMNNASQESEAVN